jgi:hypothetical protein
MTASKGKELRYIHLGFALAAGPKPVIAFGFSSEGHRRDLPAGADLSLDKWFRKSKVQKSEGAISLSRSRPLPFRIFEDLVRSPDHNYSSLQSFSGRAGRARRFPYSVITFRCKSFLVPFAAASCLDACVSLVSCSLAGSFSNTLAGLVSDVLPNPVAGSLPNFVSDTHLEFLLRPLRVPLPVPLEFLSQRSCELRFRFSDGSCPLSPSGGLLLR